MHGRKSIYIRKEDGNGVWMLRSKTYQIARGLNVELQKQRYLMVVSRENVTFLIKRFVTVFKRR